MALSTPACLSSRHTSKPFFFGGRTSTARLRLERKWTFGTLTPQASIPMKSVENMTGQTFLRGCQITDSNGAVTFKTIVPGWHSGRTIHIHVMIRTFSSTGTALTEFTTQLSFDQTLIDSLAKSVSPYSSRGLPDTTNAEDSIYCNSTQSRIGNAATGAGYPSSITFGVQTA